MRRSAALILPILAAPLAGQFVMINKADEKAPATLQDWVAQVKSKGYSEWVLLPGATNDWTAQAGAVMDTDPDLLEYGVSKASFAFSSPVAREFRAREGWDSTTRWALVGKDGSVLQSGESVPDATVLRKALENHGVQGPIQLLEAFLGRHPDREDARTNLIFYRVSLASKLMKPYLGSPAGTEVTPKADAPYPQPKELSKPLSSADDARIWGPLAALTETGFQNGDWANGFSAWISRLDPSGARFSPLMQAMAARSLPVIEAQLQRYPSDFNAWDYWVHLQDIAGGRPLRPLLDSLQSLPLPGSSAMPSEFSLGFYIQGTARRHQWRNIVDLVQPWWDLEKEDRWKVVAMDMNGKLTDALKGTWDRVLSPLVEAYLRLGQAFDADRVVREAMAWRPSPGLPRWASDLARKCGDEASAAEWARMTVPKTGAP